MARARLIVFETRPDEAAAQATQEAERAAKRQALIAKRAQRALEGLARWEKRLKFARHKAAAYKRTVTYYRKQGVIK